ncbi:MAG TPA: hypothetical protein PLQ38_01860, partial [Methanothrix sp.]|nr:hypothetical protein [Methanothrix sp.]
LKECLVYAAAAGTATTLHQGTALAQKEDFLRLAPQVKLTVLSESISTDKDERKQATCGFREESEPEK